MGSFNGLGIGLSLLFGCIILGLVAELYYLLWWKKRLTTRGFENPHTQHATELSSLFSWKKPNSPNSAKTQEELSISERIPEANGHEQDPELANLGVKGSGEESVESELIRLHNLCGPPRFLFTIKEETREDLDSEDGKSRGDRSRKGSRTRSLSDIAIAIENPFLSPLSSPPLKALCLDSYDHHGFNPLFESSTEADLNRLRSSPPPKFKFLRDAEEKLMRRLVEEIEKRGIKNGGFVQDSVVKDPSNLTAEEKAGSFSFYVGKTHHQLPQSHSTSSQVLPLASSPSTFRPLDNKSIVQ